MRIGKKRDRSQDCGSADIHEPARICEHCNHERLAIENRRDDLRQDLQYRIYSQKELSEKFSYSNKRNQCVLGQKINNSFPNIPNGIKIISLNKIKRHNTQIIQEPHDGPVLIYGKNDRCESQTQKGEKQNGR